MKNHNNPQANTNRDVILIAEDDEVNYHYLAMLLTKLDPQIKLLHALDGLEAVSLYKEHDDIGLILMDIKMPNMDGYEATKLIKALNPDVVIIAQTALTPFEARVKAIEAGCDDFITKPVDKSLLADLMSTFK
jgi:two-component system, cell cycle response regulator DivK